MNNKSLKRVEFKAKTILDEDIFGACNSLESVVMDDDTEELSNGVFNYCTSLKSIRLPKNLKTIGNGAFMECNSLTDITIPEGVTSIGQNAFFRCSNLTDVYYGGSELKWKAITIYDAENTAAGKYIHGATKHYNATPDALNTVI